MHKYLFATTRACAALIAIASVSATSQPSAQPDFADPFVLRDGDAWLAFATGPANGAASMHVQVARSTDMRTWTELGDALPRLPAWADERAGFTWAPSVSRRDGGYVLYYTARDVTSGFQCIGRARASHAEGPYVDDSPNAFVCQTDLCGSIDPSPLVTHDGAWLVWKSDENSPACRHDPRIWSQKLSRDGLSLEGPRTALIARDRAWEGDIIEAPSMVKRGDRYVLFYSANWYASSRYAVGFATCATPLGPCDKRTTDGPILSSHGEQLGPGGEEIFTDGDKAWAAYHAWSAPRTSYEEGGARSLRLAPLDLTGDKPAFGAPLDLTFSFRRPRS